MTNTNKITQFFHCAKCMGEKPDHLSPREWSELEVGWTPLGVQVWCKRHEMEVVALDFMGQKIQYVVPDNEITVTGEVTDDE